MIDPITSLAISMQSKKGTFALLLGSGISRSAQIPTGWDIILNLIERVARVAGQGTNGDAAAWYRNAYGEEPDYSRLLDALSTTSAERSQIIRQFIEPTDDERESGIKQPTAGHRAIASLVSQGYVRVIITTNFDRLLEMALADVGMVPSVISTPDGVNGTLPLAHNVCTIIKIHGDYVDSRIRNTPTELADYPDEFNSLLSQVFREYGVIISGWSGEWDSALREAMSQHLSPWFPTYWISYREPGGRARDIIERRAGRLITNLGADAFFERLADSVAAVEDMQNPELVSVDIAVATLKRYLDDPSKRIQLHDLVVGEANRVRRFLEEVPDHYFLETPTTGSVTDRLTSYEEGTAVLRSLFITGCYWATPQHDLRPWVTALERLASFNPISGSFYEEWKWLRLYPAFLTLYAGGVAALANQNFETLYALLYQPMSLDMYRYERNPMILSVHQSLIKERVALLLYPNNYPADTAASNRIRHTESLWSVLREYIPDQDRFQQLCDQYEYFFGLVHTDLANLHDFSVWSPTGLLRYREHGLVRTRIVEETDSQIQEMQDQWPPLRARMFGGSVERLQRVKAQFDELLKNRY